MKHYLKNNHNNTARTKLPMSVCLFVFTLIDSIMTTYLREFTNKTI